MLSPALPITRRQPGRTPHVTHVLLNQWQGRRVPVCWTNRLGLACCAVVTCCTLPALPDTGQLCLRPLSALLSHPLPSQQFEDVLSVFQCSGTQRLQSLACVDIAGRGVLRVPTSSYCVLLYRRVALDLQQAEDDFLEGSDLLDLDSREYLCPVCRRLGTALLPAVAPLPQPCPTQPNQARVPSPGLPNQALQHSSEGGKFHSLTSHT